MREGARERVAAIAGADLQRDRGGGRGPIGQLADVHLGEAASILEQHGADSTQAIGSKRAVKWRS